MTASTAGMLTREAVAAEVKRVTHAWSGPAMDEFVDDPPTRKQLAIADAVLAMASDALAAVTAERDEARQMLADAPHAPGCGVRVDESAERVFYDSPCRCWKAGL